MKTLNLVYPDKSDIKYKKLNFNTAGGYKWEYKVN